MIEKLSKIVKDVGCLLLEWRNSRVFNGTWVGQQFKAEVDKMAHSALTERLGGITPDIPIISEEDETSLVGKRPKRYWIIDPIDGTASFVNGYNGFVTQVALIENHRPSMAAIYAPLLETLYIAEYGKGSFLNGKSLQITHGNEPKVLIDNYHEPRGITYNLYKDLKFSEYIECGSISLKICKVADGTADIFFKNVPVRDWDLAAPQLVIEEAGGVMRDSNGTEIKYNGEYTHYGVIAAASDDICMRIASWYNNFKRREIGK